MLELDRMDETGPWHPKIAELYRYWQQIHPQSGLPGRQHMDPLEIPALLPNLWLLDVEPEPLRFRYRLVGTKLAQFFGYAIRGRYLGEATQPHFTQQHLVHYEGVVKNRTYHYRKGPPAFAVDRPHLRVERILLPLATDGLTVDVILALTVLTDGQGREM
ncbi:MAG: PAS domain-containing protein [Proteobacteria bacterium]|nr:PAS domain-containing protein [Pseudomonadota bacterium]MBI3499779.1 PAS domain-containing protein [Pseudomonadota bacterium]